MSESTPTNVRAYGVIVNDLKVAKAAAEEAEKALAALPGNAPEDERDAAQIAFDEANEAVAELAEERKAAAKAALEGQLAAKEAEYKAATTAGVKAALRRDMNKIRVKLGLPEQIAGSKSSGPRFSDDVLSILEDEDFTLAD